MGNLRMGISLVLIAALGLAARLDAQDSSKATSIPFGDAAHQSFFNYEKYLAQTGSKGETPETWDRLTAAERLKEVAEVEAKLSRLHDELAAKATLSADEAALFSAVWGTRDSSGPLGLHGAPKAEKPHYAAAEAGVRTLSGKVAGFQTNWGRMFDGGRQSAVGGVEARSTQPGSKPAASIGLSPATNALHLDKDKAPVPPLDGGSAKGGSRATPFALGAVLLVSLYWGARKLGGRGGRAAISEFPGTDKIMLDELGRPILPRGVIPPEVRTAYRAEESDPGCTDKDCVCPPSLSTCPVNAICNCPAPPPAPLPQCKCPPADSSCTAK